MRLRAVAAAVAVVLIAAATAPSCTDASTPVKEEGAAPTEVVNEPDSGLWAGSFTVGVPLEGLQVGTVGTLIIQNTTGRPLQLRSVTPLENNGAMIVETRVHVWSEEDQAEGRVAAVGVATTYPPEGTFAEVSNTVVPDHYWFGIVFGLRRNSDHDDSNSLPFFEDIKITYDQGGRTFYTVADARFEIVPPP